MDRSEAEASISEFTDRFEALPEITEPPNTTLSILREQTGEKYWNRLLRYFLDPDGPHGLGSDFLRAFLDLIDERTGATLGYTDFDLEAVEVQSEVHSDNGRPDLLLYLEGEWFVCIELKVTAPETGAQTEEYATSGTLGSINVSEYIEANRCYLYLSKKTHSPPTSDRFARLYWSDVQDAIGTLRNEARGRYPTRSVAQLADFQDTIRDVAMNDQPYDDQQAAFVELYLQNVEAIDTVRGAFDEMIAQQIEGWATQFRERYRPDNWDDSWNCDPDKYGKIYRDEWWRDENGDEVQDWSAAEYRLEFRHHVRKEQSWKDGEVRFKAVIPRNSDDEFRERCSDLFSESLEELTERSKSTQISIVGDSRTLTSATYSFDPSDGPEGYYIALSEAFEEHTVLVPLLTSIFEQAVDEFVS